MDYSKGIKSLEFNNDILMEILVRLPPKSIFKFTCVSKRWNDLIMDPCFFKLYRQRSRKLGYSSCRLLGFVQCNKHFHFYFGRPRHWKHRFLSVSSEELGGNSGGGGGGGRSFFPPKRGCFITSSSDGLFLWGVIPTEFHFLSRHIPTEYHVGNPITKRWVTLPPPPPPLFPDRSISVGLASNDLEGSGYNINFRVVVATGTDERHEHCGAKTMPIQTYSSRTGRWRRSKLIFEKTFSIDPFKSPTVIGRVFHWLSTSEDYLVVYDSSLLDEEDDGDCKSGSLAMPTNRENSSNNKKKKCVLELIALPFYTGSKVIWRTDNGQTLWYGVGSSHKGGVRIYRLEMGGGKHDKDDWRLVNKVVDVDTLKKEIIGISSKEMEMDLKRCWAARLRRDDYDEETFRSYREMVSVIAFIPWDTRLVIVRLWERVFVYDWENQRMDEVQLHGRPCFTDLKWEWHPYFHSISLSPYAFLLRKNKQSTSNKHLKHKLPSI